uniref:mitogen-activated protein kinase kinase n=1 Tax=Hanusia phi TaxID=3032 RepID=A0A7S0EQY0_9CRYP|mmetsp:Transcript_29439/g.66662  ORF Transcript_29439/g.66662 Transcript_29439/m.66662 type:complete len:495 (+) Transcript_29439:518-2002(+)
MKVFDLNLRSCGLDAGWFCSPNRSPKRSCGSGWGACIDLPDSNRDLVRPESKAFVQDDILIDADGLRITTKKTLQRDSELVLLLQAARRASQRQDDDSLSTASTHVDDEPAVISATRPGKPAKVSAISDKMKDIRYIAPVWRTPSSSSDKSIQLPSLTGFGSSFSQEGLQGRKEVKLCNLQKVKEVGKGNTATVWKCVDCSDRKTLAVKEMPVDRDEKRKNMALREMVTMLGIEHAGIVTCHNVFYCKNVFHIAMEYMDAGSLLDAMRRTCHSGSYSMPLPALAHVCQKVLSALDFLHEGMQLVHRDVKPGNILLSMQGEVKLADLGICAQPMTEGGMHAEHTGVCATPVTEWIGTVTYMSPERLLGEAYGYSADMWSLGLVLIEAAVGRYPLTPAEFHGNLQFWDLLDIVMSDSTCALKLLEGLDKEYDELRTFTDACLIKNGLERPFAQDLLAHPLLNAADQSVFAQWVSQSLTESDRDFRDSQCLEVDGWA